MVLEFIMNFSLLKVVKATEIEHTQLMALATAKNYSYHTKSYYEECMYKDYLYLPAGLWYKILSLSKAKNPWDVTITNIKDFARTNITKESLEEWVESQNLVYDPYYYQADAFYKLAKFPRSKAEIGTGGGKTFTACLLSRYYLQNILNKGQKVLIIVPRRALVDQFLKDMKNYCDDGFLIIDSIYGGGKRYAESNVIVGTFQSLCNYDADFFEDIGVVIVDEAHTAKSKSIKDEIIPKLPWKTCNSFHGMTGTEPDDAIGQLILESYIGPTLQFTPTSELEEVGAIVPTEVLMVEIKHNFKTAELYYNADETQEATTDRTKYEKQLVLYNPERLNIIFGILDRLPNNCVMLFNTLEYARYMYDYFKHNSNKEVYLISGITPDKERNATFLRFEQITNGIIFATYGTMSTGISINNIHYVASADGGKAKIIVNQSIGRGVRLMAGKEFLQVLDFYDNIPKYKQEWNGAQSNIFLRHAIARRKLYDRRKTKHQTKIIEL